MMKNVTLSIILLYVFFTDAVKAQNNNPKNEIGISLFSVLSYSKQEPRGMHEPRWLNGIMYKRFFRSNALRAGGEYFSNTYANTTDLMQQKKEVSGKNSSFEYRIGLERSYLLKPFILYLILDVAVLHQIYESSWKDTNNKTYSEYNVIDAVGLLPALGIKYKVATRVSISAETGFNLYTNSFHNDITLNPLKSLSVNYHF